MNNQQSTENQTQVNPTPNPNPYNPYYQMNQVRNQVPTVGNYIVMYLLQMIPLVNFILLIVWAVGGSGTPLWKTNYARANFILMAISIGISVLLALLFWGIIFAALGSLGDVF